MADGELEYARVKDNSIDDAWGVFNDGELVAIVDTETMAARLCAAEEMLTALKAVKDAVDKFCEETGEVIWIDPPYQLPGVHESVGERLRAAIEKATVSERA